MYNLIVFKNVLGRCHLYSESFIALNLLLNQIFVQFLKIDPIINVD